MGMIAALLGRERDLYYEELGMERARIGVALKSSVRSLMQMVNYLFTKNEGWDGSRGHTQIPLELILPRPPERFVRYQVYFQHRNPEWVELLHEQLERGEYGYPLYLGLSECPAWVENTCLYPSGDVHWVRDPEEALPVGTAVPLSKLVELPPLERLVGRRLLKDRMPLDFYPDRRLKAAGDILWEAEGRPLPLKLRGELFNLPDKDTYGCFLEP